MVVDKHTVFSQLCAPSRALVNRELPVKLDLKKGAFT